MKKICLIGFMGSGKTTIGKTLAQQLQLEWVDLDQYIEQQAARTISQIFAAEGEAAFRKMEADCLERVLEGDYEVISTGGGIITSDKNVEKLHQYQTFFLDYPFDCLYERIKGDSARPLATSYEALHKRFEMRMPLYKRACVHKIWCKDKSINRIVEEIINKLKK